MTARGHAAFTGLLIGQGAIAVLILEGGVGVELVAAWTCLTVFGLEWLDNFRASRRIVHQWRRQGRWVIRQFRRVARTSS